MRTVATSGLASSCNVEKSRARNIVIDQRIGRTHASAGMRARAEAQAVRKVLAEMPPHLAMTLVLRTVEGFSCEEIAGVRNVPPEVEGWTELEPQ